MSYFRTQLENFLAGLEVKADRVLDIGGGANPVKGRTKTWEVEKYIIADNKLEKPVDKIHVEMDLNIHIGSNIPIQHFSISENRVDVIFCLEVFEYIWDPATAISNIWFALKKGGIAYISFPLLYPIHEPAGHDYLRYTEEGVEKLLEEAGFKSWDKVVRLAKPDSQYFLNEFYKIEGMHYRKDEYTRYHTGYIYIAKK